MQTKLFQQGCREFLSQNTQKFNLIFADPPFNIGYKYPNYSDKLTDDVYLSWCCLWIKECAESLTDNGCLWIAINDKYAAELCCIAKKHLFLKNWVIWTYNFGKYTKKKFSPSHTHLLYFVKSPKNYVFNNQLPENLVPSLRQSKYKDKRADPKGRVPDDVWAFSRICGTFKERTDYSCQMPLSVLNRIISFCSNPNDWVFDPFLGSGTTIVAAQNLGRNSVGTDISARSLEITKARLHE